MGDSSEGLADIETNNVGNMGKISGIGVKKRDCSDKQ
jgi:hypothetical protein